MIYSISLIVRDSVFEPMYLAGSEGFEPSTWRLGGVRAVHYTPGTTSYMIERPALRAPFSNFRSYNLNIEIWSNDQTLKSNHSLYHLAVSNNDTAIRVNMNQIPEKIKEYFDYSLHDTVELVTTANVRALLLSFLPVSVFQLVFW